MGQDGGEDLQEKRAAAFARLPVCERGLFGKQIDKVCWQNQKQERFNYLSVNRLIKSTSFHKLVL